MKLKTIKHAVSIMLSVPAKLGGAILYLCFTVFLILFARDLDDNSSVTIKNVAPQEASRTLVQDGKK